MLNPGTGAAGRPQPPAPGNRQAGFTLVEIGVIMILIGLVIGGLLKGQHLMTSTRVHDLADQQAAIKASYHLFVDRFNWLPGDMPCSEVELVLGDELAMTGCSSSPVTGGNGDGKISTITEASALWAHLSSAGLLSQAYSGVASSASQYATSAVASGQVPANAFQGSLLLAHMNNYIEGNTGATITRLAFSFGGKIPVPILRDLDLKLDDGVAGSGILRSASSGTPGSGGIGEVVEYAISGGDDCLVSSSSPADWYIDSDNPGCNGIYLY